MEGGRDTARDHASEGEGEGESERAEGNCSMIDLDLLRGITKVYGHRREGGPCTDALAAALIVRDVLPDVEVRFLEYESEELETVGAEPGLLFADISPPRRRLDEFVKMRAIVIDHHDTVREDVRVFEEAGLGAFGAERGVSAATLAFREVWGPLARAAGRDEGHHEVNIERVARLIGIYDTWQRSSPEWSRANDLASLLYFFPDWLELGGEAISWLIEREGMNLIPTLRRKDKDRVARMVETAYRFVTPKGTRVAVMSSTELISAAADACEDDADVVVGFLFSMRHGVPSMKLSFRSRRGGHLVRPIAEALAPGGGGHDNAASAWVELHGSHRHPYAMIRTLMEAW